MQELTLTYLKREDAICLGLKKRGFGKGNWNGYGGKVEDGEDILDAAIREVQEESTVSIEKGALQKAALIEFIFEDGRYLLVHTFFIHEWKGEPKETEEMKPKWFPFSEIPYTMMWEDDQYWLPRALCGEKLRGTVWFDASDTHIKKMSWEEVSGF